MMNNNTLKAIELLRRLVETPSVSRQEDKAADLMAQAMTSCGFEPVRLKNNVWTSAPGFSPHCPTLLLNAHLDTVKPVASWSRNPYECALEGDRLYGLGSNDCGGGLVSLWQTFTVLAQRPQPYNLLFLASAEEEVSGADGIRAVLPTLPPVQLAIVGEPTGMQPAVAERGLMVLDLTAHGQSGHAARGEGVNALYIANDDINFLRQYRFERVSEFLGRTMVNVTMIQAGTQHNVVPDVCTMVADVRTNELYDNEEVLHFLQDRLKSEVKARSVHLRSSRISLSHPVIARLTAEGMVPFGSPTLSDQALMPFTSFKWGPGESSRSHTADEFITLGEIENAVDTYLRMLDGTPII